MEETGTNIVTSFQGLVVVIKLFNVIRVREWSSISPTNKPNP